MPSVVYMDDVCDASNSRVFPCQLLAPAVPTPVVAPILNAPVAIGV
ncbi:MAG: hypothetical protein II929_06065 [Succinivibrio sp.]|nr:hypothetical protein [Succinivibrio sp.]